MTPLPEARFHTEPESIECFTVDADKKAAAVEEVMHVLGTNDDAKYELVIVINKWRRG